MLNTRLVIILILLSNICYFTLAGTVNNKGIDSLTNLLCQPDPDNSINFELARTYEYIEDYQNAIKYYQIAYDNYVAAKDTKNIVATSNYFGYALYTVGEYDKASQQIFSGLELAEKVNLKKYFARAYMTLGFIYRNNAKLEKALEYFQQSYDKAVEAGQRSYEHTALNEMGNVNAMMGNFSKAADLQKRSIDIKKEIGDTLSLMYSYNDLAGTYYYLQQYTEAKEYFRKSMKIARERDQKGIIAAGLANMAAIFDVMGLPDSARACYDKSLELANELKVKSQYEYIYLSLSDFNARHQEYKDAYLNHKLYFAYYDSIKNENVSNQMNEIQTKYETEKKEKELHIKNLELEKSEVTLARQLLIIYTFIVGFIVVIFFSFFLYRQYKAKRKAYTQVALQRDEIVEKNHELEQQAEEIHTINDQLNQAYEEISNKNEEIVDSIQYAKHIQKAILPSFTLMERVFQNSFVINKPKDIIGGDFYWLANKGDQTFIAVADCTGHGVPGALMSMLGISMLNDIIANLEYTQPAGILNELRRRVIKILNQSGEIGTSKDGMDIALCSVDKQQDKAGKIKVVFSGAHNPLYMIKNPGNPVIEELKGDKMPVGFYIKMPDFTNQEVLLSPGYRLYLFTDGFPDQFGGPKGSKYRYKTFKQLICNSSHLEAKEQGEYMESELNKWVSYNENIYDQIDDITVIGIKL